MVNKVFQLQQVQGKQDHHPYNEIRANKERRKEKKKKREEEEK